MKNNASGKSVDTIAAVLKEVLEELVGEIHPHRNKPGLVAMDSSLERDLGLDSLALVELLSRIEKRLGVKIPERKFVEANTPQDLLREIQGASEAIPSTGTQVAAAVVTGDVESTPRRAHTLIDVLDWHVRAQPHRPHVRFYADDGDGEQVLTYGQLGEGSAAVAAGLQRRGLHKGDAVAIMLPTGRDYFLSFMGVLLAGGTPVPIYPPFRMAQIEDHLRRHRAILKNSRTTMLITVPQAKTLARILKSHVDSMRDVLTVEELRTVSGSFDSVPVEADDLAFLQYTSGSTGTPKGVMLTHANLLANIRSMSRAARVDDTDVVVSWLPLYHDMGLIGTWMSSLYNAIPFVLMSPIDFISRPQRWFWAIHRYRGTLSAGPNFAYELCLKRLNDDSLEGLDLSSWRAAFNGAEPVSPDTIDRFCDRFAKYGFRRDIMMPVYGLAECSVGLSFPPVGRGHVVDHIRREPFTRKGEAVPARSDEPNSLRFVGCGYPLPGHEIRVVDVAGLELPERREGRVQFRGPSATKGYFNNPVETKKLMHGDWLDTGDVGYVVGGEIYITGRRKDIIIRAGRNIYPSELENAVGNVGGVRKGNVAAFGTHDSVSGTEKLVVLAETRCTDPDEQERIRAEINGLAGDLMGTPVDDIVLTPPHTIPKTSSGKIRRTASRALYDKGEVGKRPRAVWFQLARMSLGGVAPQARRVLRSAAGFLYTGYAYILFTVLVVAAFFPIVLSPKLSWRWGVLRTGCRVFMTMMGMPVRVEGLEHLPRDRDCLLVSNHASYLDSCALPAALPVHFRFVAKVELTRRWLVRVFIRSLGTEFVERFDKQRGVADARRIGRNARGRVPLLFYPEGGTWRMPGLRGFQMGAFAVAAESGFRVVPISLSGTRSAFRPGTWMPRPGSINVSIGPPIDPPAGGEDEFADTWTAAIRMRDQARRFILENCREPDLAADRIPV